MTHMTHEFSVENQPWSPRRFSDRPSLFGETFFGSLDHRDDRVVIWWCCGHFTFQWLQSQTIPTFGLAERPRWVMEEVTLGLWRICWKWRTFCAAFFFVSEVRHSLVGYGFRQGTFARVGHHNADIVCHDHPGILPHEG